MIVSEEGYKKGDKARVIADHLPEKGGVFLVEDYKKPIVFLRNVPGKLRPITMYNEKNLEKVYPEPKPEPTSEAKPQG